jgi:hypothetical protein
MGVDAGFGRALQGQLVKEGGSKCIVATETGCTSATACWEIP